PLLVTAQFGMLEALAPGRIDLGLGRAPGTDPATAAALRRGHGANDTFPEQVLELFGFLGRSSPPDTPTRTCMLCPARGRRTRTGFRARRTPPRPGSRAPPPARRSAPPSPGAPTR